MTSLEYYIEQVEQFISALNDDIKSGEGTTVTQTKLAVYREVLEHLEEIEQEPSYNSIKNELNGDTVSRQAVKEQMIKYGFHAPDMTVTEFVEDLPSVNPQPKTGRWVENDRGIPICSCCGKYKYEGIDGSIYDDAWFPNYCPNCGEKMVEKQKGSKE